MRKDSRGDTIIEVLFAMTIIGVVLAAAYAVASKNLQVSQLSKERTQATELAISQLDQLKTIEQDFLELNPIVDAGGSFCLDITSSTYVIDSTDPACSVDGYQKSITKTDNQYRVAVEWIPPGGNDQNLSIVEFFYSDYDFSLTGATNLAIYTISVVNPTPSTLSATLGATILNQTGILESGIVYSTTNNPRVGAAGSTTVPATGAPSQFQLTISGLDANTVYFARTYIRNSSGYTYGSVMAINSSGDVSTLPIVTTDSISNVTLNSATVAGTVVGDNGRAVTSRGIAYGTNQSPTISNNYVQAGNGEGAFTSAITGLNSNTTYYARAYATNATGTSYGQQVTFTTLTSANISVVVRKIPPAAGNTTPSCTNAATLDRSGTTIRINGVNRTTNASSTATFNGLNLNTPYTATGVSAPAGHELCTTSQSITTGGSGTTTTSTAFRIRPICTNQIVGYTPGYWVRGARRADLDNWFYTSGITNWNTWFVAGHYAAPGAFMYVYSGISDNSPAALYYIYEAIWRNGDPIYQMVCPS